MKFVILYSILVICIADYGNADCNQCGITSKVACFSNTQYFVCNDAKQIDISSLKKCDTGICGDTMPPCSTGPSICPNTVEIAPSPITTTAVVTVTSATATAWCTNNNKAPGRYAQPGDKTCSNYVYCYLNGGLMGWVYSCVGTTFFNPILYSIIVICIADYGNAICNQCGVTSKVACFSNTQYFVCNAANQIDISVLITCATGVCGDTMPPCSTGTAACPNTVTIAPAPVTTTTVAPVTTTTTLAPVITTTTLAPVTTTTTLAPVTTTTTLAPVTTTTTLAPVITTTTLAPVTTTAAAVVTVTSATATAWCATKAPGRYAQPGDKTCSNYVYCYLNGGIMGWVYSCVGTTLFNPVTSTCQPGYICV
ncbi:unnamed protein product [Diamesa serratosioi]